MSCIVFRDLEGIAEFNAAEELQRIVWGRNDTPDPADLMMVIQNEGGLVAGAFVDGELKGYVFGFPTREADVQHSHRLAVHPDQRGSGLGIKLKWHQRDWCLTHGIRLVRWTFDPMRHVNANLNIGRLGAVSSTYHVDFYGEMAGINAGVPSDRLLAEWHVVSERVAAYADGAVTFPDAVQRVHIGKDFERWMAEDPERAVREKLRVRGEIVGLFSNGFAVCGYDADRADYLLTKSPHP
jgi:predicted GNAT superfamily acetyltransferase